MFVYLDNNASTPLAPEVARTLIQHFGDYANPSSVHQAGQAVRKLILDARYQISALLNGNPQEIVFTGSGTESNNLADLAVDRAMVPRRI
jgi:cysteine desulfurase